MAVNVKPTKEEMLAAAGRVVPDIIGHGLSVLFCGINPGLYTAATGHPFARPGNRFWPALHASGFTPRLFAPHEARELLTLGYGITVWSRAPRRGPSCPGMNIERRKLAAKGAAPPGLLAGSASALPHDLPRPKGPARPAEEDHRRTRIWVCPTERPQRTYRPGPRALFAELRRAAPGRELIEVCNW